jgi:hypothetical protein
MRRPNKKLKISSMKKVENMASKEAVYKTRQLSFRRSESASRPLSGFW